jgi:hypothetical protein
MTQCAWPVLKDEPSTLQWDFGGYLYGLEPLTLPSAGSWPLQPSRCSSAEGPGHDGTGARARIALIDIFGVPPELTRSRCPARELFWFRWITGHQVSFILWRMMGRLLHGITRGNSDPVAALEPLRQYVRGYCTMLLYTASCPRRVYEDVIRPSMRLRHPAFSGSWAPDFAPVKELLRGHRTVFTGLPGAEGLSEAVKLHELIHGIIADRLVPSGRSLLQQSAARPRHMPVAHLLYDTYFLTVRAAIPEDAVAAQLVRRLVAIARDIAANGLYPADSTSVTSAAQVVHADVEACGAEITSILNDVANWQDAMATVAPMP